MSRDCCVDLPCGAMGLSAVCDCGISLSYSLTIFNIYYCIAEKSSAFSTSDRSVLLMIKR